MDGAANDTVLQGITLNLYPRDAVLSLGGSNPATETLRRFAHWFHCAYRVERLFEGVVVPRKCSAVERALKVRCKAARLSV